MLIRRLGFFGVGSLCNVSLQLGNVITAGVPNAEGSNLTGLAQRPERSLGDVQGLSGCMG